MCCVGTCVQLTTSLFCENRPSCMLSSGIHLNGSFIMFPDLSCLKYSELYISSASPKSATLMTPPLSILWLWKMHSWDSATCYRWAWTETGGWWGSPAVGINSSRIHKPDHLEYSIIYMYSTKYNFRQTSYSCVVLCMSSHKVMGSLQWACPTICLNSTFLTQNQPSKVKLIRHKWGA